jgi:hypothetical protein
MKKERDQNVKTGIGLIALLVFIAIVLTSINACEYFGIGNTMSWKEEVLLHDGSKIVIKRLVNLGGKRTLESREQRDLDETVTFTLPGSNKEVTWKTDFRDERPEPNSLNLLVFDIVNATPYIAAYPAGCIAYNKWQRPNPPYIFFKYDGSNWKRIYLEEFPAEISKVNVIVGRPPAELQKSFYTVEQVKEENRNISSAEYKTVIRTPIKIWCEELIYDGKMWRGFSGLDKLPTYEACVDVCDKSGIKAEYCPCERLFKTNMKKK